MVRYGQVQGETLPFRQLGLGEGRAGPRFPMGRTESRRDWQWVECRTDRPYAAKAGQACQEFWSE